MCAGQWELTSPWLPKQGIGALGEKNSHFFVPCSLGSPGAAAVARKAGDNLIFQAEKRNPDLWALLFAVCPSTPSPKSESP